MPNSRLANPKIQAALRAQLIGSGHVDPDAIWHSLDGGRTNAIWRIDDANGARVCKLFSESGGTILFPNCPADEARVLEHLGGTGLAPNFLANIPTAFGTCLIYEHAKGHVGTGDAAAVARALRNLHQTPPADGIREIGPGAAGILAAGDQILSLCSGPDKDRLSELRPAATRSKPGRSVFLHGDCVPANVVQDGGSVTFIDWQCPAVGDACEDLSTFLSPAMQHLYGGRRIEEHEMRDFLAAYGDEETVSRLRHLRPFYHWRMATHCLWKSQNGESEYFAAFNLEIAELEKRQQPDAQPTDQRARQH